MTSQSKPFLYFCKRTQFHSTNHYQKQRHKLNLNPSTDPIGFAKPLEICDQVNRTGGPRLKFLRTLVDIVPISSSRSGSKCSKCLGVSWPVPSYFAQEEKTRWEQRRFEQSKGDRRKGRIVGAGIAEIYEKALVFFRNHSRSDERNSIFGSQQLAKMRSSSSSSSCPKVGELGHGSTWLKSGLNNKLIILLPKFVRLS